jgi:SAM-dependent methyltransferase
VTAEDTNGHQDLEGLPAAYAAWRESALGQITDALEQDLILELVGPPTGLRILDVGCGDGILAVELAARGAQATGVDPSPQMIAAARKRAQRNGKDVSFERAAAEALPFTSGTIDVVLKPGGRLIIGELGRSSSWAAVRRVKGWLGSPVWSRARFRSPSELRQLAIGAGLVDVSVMGAVFYPPIGLAARLLRPIDRRLGACTTTGAAFLVLAATKPQGAPKDDGVGFAYR